MKILIVDDSKFSRGRVRKALENSGHTLIEGKDGEEGVALFKSEQPDIVISDLLMPKVDGIEQLKQIRATGSKVPVVIISADIQESSREICQSLGICSFLNKPFKANELLEAIDVAMNKECEVENA